VVANCGHLNPFRRGILKPLQKLWLFTVGWLPQSLFEKMVAKLPPDGELELYRCFACHRIRLPSEWRREDSPGSTCTFCSSSRVIEVRSLTRKEMREVLKRYDEVLEGLDV